MPASSGEKVVLEVTNYLAVIFFSQYVADILPKSSLGIPKISLYFGSLIIQCLVSVCVNIYIIRLNEGEHDENKIPDWIEKWICGYLAYFLKMKRPKNQAESILLSEYQDSKNNEKNNNLTDIEKYLKLITTHLNSMKISQNKNNDKKLLENERKFVASVLDRFFFFVSLVYLIICLVSFILANKNFWRFT